MTARVTSSWLPEFRGGGALNVLRVGVAGCFIGHGAWGVITKAGWLPYFAAGGIHPPLAWTLMPWIGTMDITIGIIALLWPTRALLTWAVVWATWTALCRPLAGESFWEFVERAGNYGVPLALFVAAGAGPLFRRLDLREARLTAELRERLAWVLRCVTAAVLVGHAGCTLSEPNASFCHNYLLLWPHAPETGVVAFGVAEAVLALIVLVRPAPGLLRAVVVWKFGTESLFLFAHAPVWEVVERFGSYTAPLALAGLALPRLVSSPEPATSPA